MEKRQVVITGAGASGLMAAITAARNGAKVTLLSLSAARVEIAISLFGKDAQTFKKIYRIVHRKAQRTC